MFCVQCGANQPDDSAFCGNCGTAMGGRGNPVPVAAPPAAKRGSPLVKILLIALGVVFLLAAAGIAGLVYAAYYVKGKVVQTAQQHGIDLDELSKPPAATGRLPEACSLLPAGEAARILGLPIERTEREDSPGQSVCHYFSKAVSPEESRAQVQTALEGLERTGEPKQAELTHLENVTKGLIGGATGGVAYFSVTVVEDGRAQMMGMKIFSAVGGPDSNTPVQGIGDDAVFGPLNSLLMFRKGERGVSIDLRMVPNGRQKGIEMAKTILTRL